MTQERLSTSEIDFSDEENTNNDFENDWTSAVNSGFTDPEIVKELKAFLIEQGYSPEKAESLIALNRSIASEMYYGVQNQGE
jgi:hypothetical protein